MGSGWKRAFTIEKERAEEYIELYKSMGYEVRVVEPSACEEECSVCYAGGGFVEIWIKKEDEVEDG